MPARDDYILRFVELAARAIAEALKLRGQGKIEQAMIVVVQAQEKLFAPPMAEFIGLPIDQQIRLLTISEPPQSARSKLLAYASLLREAGLIYAERDRSELAASAFQLALHVTLQAAIVANARDAEINAAADDLLPRIPADQLLEPTQELLRRFGELPAA